MLKTIERLVDYDIRDNLDSDLLSKSYIEGAFNIVNVSSVIKALGGMISLLLWLLVVNMLLKKLENKGAPTVVYADDVIIIARGQCVNTIRDMIESALKIVSSWTKEWNSTKTAFAKPGYQESKD